MRYNRKNRIFRLYLLVLCVSLFGGGMFALDSQRRYYSRRLDGLSDSVASLASIVSNTPVVTATSPLVPSAVKESVDYVPGFYLEGKGLCKSSSRLWCYADYSFDDGTQSRFYFPVNATESELLEVARQVQRHAFQHPFIPPSKHDEKEASPSVPSFSIF